MDIVDEKGRDISGWFDKMIEEHRREKKMIGKDLHKTMKRNARWFVKGKIKSAINDFKWKMRIFKAFKLLYKLNPDKVMISCPGVLDMPEHDDYENKGDDMLVYLPYRTWTGRIKWRFQWIFMLSSKSLFESDMKEAQKYGMECPILDPEDNESKFEILYMDEENMNTPEKVENACREWFKIFLPEFAEKIEYTEDVSDWLEEKLGIKEGIDVRKDD